MSAARLTADVTVPFIAVYFWRTAAIGASPCFISAWVAIR